MNSATTEFTVRYAETDQMGIVHHSVYPVWFEAGRTEFIKKAGISYSEVEAKGLLLPLISLKCEYKGFAKYDDRITVETYLKDMTPVRMTFGYRVYRNDDLSNAITTGETMHVWTNKILKPINLKKYDPELYNLFESNFKESLSK